MVAASPTLQSDVAVSPFAPGTVTRPTKRGSVVADFLIEGGLHVAPHAERDAARRTTARHATDAADLRYLLDLTRALAIR